MKNFSTDLKQIDTVTLSDKATKLRYPINLGFSTGIVCIIVAGPLFDLFGLEDFRILPIIAALIAFAIGAYCFIYTRQIKKELSTRTITQEEKATIKTNKKNVMIRTFVIVFALLLVIFFLSKMDYGSNYEKGECRNCGRKTSLVAGYDMCKNCYDGFIDWQKDNWTED